MTEVIAAIPNYNMGNYLERLIPSLLEQEKAYKHIYVLDDKSTDNSRAVVERFGKRVTFVDTDQNTGAGGARNRIIPYCKDETLIHFIDADIDMISTKNVETINRIYEENPDLAFVVGLIVDENNHQSKWNYGPRQTIGTAMSAALLIGVTSLPKPVAERAIRLFTHRPNIYQTPHEAFIHWGTEANIVFRAKTFRDTFGGFDEKIREHDIQPIANTAQDLGMRALFSSELAVRHLEGNVRTYNRLVSLIKAEYYIAKKYGGILRWVLPSLKRK